MRKILDQKVLHVKNDNGYEWLVPLEVISAIRATCIVNDIEGNCFDPGVKSIERWKELFYLGLDDDYNLKMWWQRNGKWDMIEAEAKMIKCDNQRPTSFTDANTSVRMTKSWTK